MGAMTNMEMTLTVFDALATSTIILLIAFGLVIVGAAFCFYRYQVKQYEDELEDYHTEVFAKDVVGSTEKSRHPEKPSNMLWFLPTLLTSGIGFIILLICGLSMASLEIGYSQALDLRDRAESFNKPLHPHIRKMIEIWPELVAEQKETGDYESYAEDVDRFNAVTQNAFTHISDYVLINEYMRLCFDQDADLRGVQNTIAHLPASQEEFVKQWEVAAYDNEYRKKALCRPEIIFKSLDVWVGYY